MALGLAPTGGGAAMALPVLSGPATPSAMSMLSRRISCGSGGSSSLRFRVVIAVRSYTIEIAKINLIKRSRTIHGQSQQTNQLKEQDKSSVPVGTGYGTVLSFSLGEGIALGWTKFESCTAVN